MISPLQLKFITKKCLLSFSVRFYHCFRIKFFSFNFKKIKTFNCSSSCHWFTPRIRTISYCRREEKETNNKCCWFSPVNQMSRYFRDQFELNCMQFDFRFVRKHLHFLVLPFHFKQTIAVADKTVRKQMKCRNVFIKISHEKFIINDQIKSFRSLLVIWVSVPIDQQNTKLIKCKMLKRK